ncbi:MAG TPA: dihydropteroate synthase [Ignavibacteria bacterium]|nr:dihydropteroate synthase [Ignavibacteria bacterium]HMR40455.1 dihydropteroate synthase [Ignavibacteria bacterium]
MGILNITPDSFSDGGKYFDDRLNLKKVIEDAVRMQKDGADFIDVGGESTRPGSETISTNEELDRVIPVISELKKILDIPVSIDTYKSEVAEEALKSGACIVNDISGFRFDEKLPSVTARYNASCILMHIKGTPKDMQKEPVYQDVVKEVYEYLQGSISIAKKNGIKQIITDPGIGFGKTLVNNLDLIRNLGEFRKLGFPVLLGVSRKSFIDKIQKTDIDERLEGTIAANTIGIVNGANIIRVHDVKENQKASITADKILYK